MFYEKVTNQGNLKSCRKLTESCKSYLLKNMENHCPHPLQWSPAYTSHLSVCLRSQRLANGKLPVCNYCVYRRRHASKRFHAIPELKKKSLNYVYFILTFIMIFLFLYDTLFTWILYVVFLLFNNYLIVIYNYLMLFLQLNRL